LVEGQITEIQWRRFERSAPSLAAIAKYRFMQLRGKLHYPVPNPPKLIQLVDNVQLFPDFSRKTYFVAEELLGASGSNLVSFTFGGPRNARSPGEWVQANLDCIRTNGIVLLSKLEKPYKPYSTTLCAVVVDRDTVSILPAHHFGFGQQSIPNK